MAAASRSGRERGVERRLDTSARRCSGRLRRRAQPLRPPFLRQPHDSHHTTVAPQVDAGHVQLALPRGSRPAPVALVIELTLGARATEYSETSAPHNPRQRADLRARTNEGNEPLHVAADKGHLELAQWLVRTTKGENVCSRDDDGWQPMHNAAINGHLEVCKWLWGQRGRYPEVRPDTRLRCRVAALLCKCARPPHPSGGPAGYLARRLATVACRSPRRPFGRDPMDGQSRRQRHCGHERRVDSAARGGSRWPSRGGHLARGARCVDSRACDER